MVENGTTGIYHGGGSMMPLCFSFLSLRWAGEDKIRQDWAKKRRSSDGQGVFRPGARRFVDMGKVLAIFRRCVRYLLTCLLSTHLPITSATRQRTRSPAST